jgi:cytochrome-b5 reductase
VVKYLAFGGAGVAGAYAYYYLTDPMGRWGIEGGIPKKKKEEAAPAAPAPKVFTGGDQGFVSLKLESVETINTNTKKFRFAFDDPESVSGLVIACRCWTRTYGGM